MKVKEISGILPSFEVFLPFQSKKGLFFMDGYQQNKTTIEIGVDNRKDLNSSQILIPHHNVQRLKNKLLELTVLLQLDSKKG
jgi:hypothetical protein